MTQRSRFARLSIQLSNVSQIQINRDIEADASINEETKQYLKNVVEQSTIHKDEINEQPNTQVSSPLVKSPMKYRRGNSVILLKNLDIMRIKQAEDEGFLKKSRFSTQKQFEERKARLNQALKLNEKIDMKDNYMQNLAVEIAVKAIKTYNEAQFLIKIFTENTIFQKYASIVKKNRNFINLMNYQFYPKNSVIYETGDFGQNYYFLLQGKLFQLLPTSEEIISSPIKLTNTRGSQKPELHLFSLLRGQEGMTPRTLKNHQKDYKNSPLLNQSHNMSMSMIVEKDFLQYVPRHKFNQYIHPGQGFGDTELLSRQRRGCTIFCDEDSHLISISQEVFDMVMGEEKAQLINSKILFLKQFEFLEGIPNTRLMQIIDTSISIHLNSKNILYQEGEECDSFYFIRKGEIHLVKQLDDPTLLTNANQQSEQTQITYADELDLHKAMNRRKKKQIRVPILILGENSYFGDYEILKKLPYRMLQAVVSSQECELIQVKAQKLISLVKTFGKYQNLIHNEKVRDEFMERRLQLITNQKQEQNLNRLQSEYTTQETKNNAKSATGYVMIRDRQSSLQTQPTLSNSPQNSQQPMILKNDKVPMRIKSQTTSYDFEGQGISLQKVFQQNYSPASSRKYLPFPSSKFDESSLNNNSPSSSFFGAKSERNIGLNSQNVLEQKIQQQKQFDKQKQQQASPSSQKQFLYDFSIKESKSQVMEEIQEKQVQQKSMQLICDMGPVHPQQQQSSQTMLSIKINTPQSVKQKKYIHRKYNSSTQISLPQQSNIEEAKSSRQDLINMRSEIQKNLFQTFVENAERSVQQKQEIVNKLAQNNQNKKTGDIQKPVLFEDEFMKGFNQMYLRKFGKKFEKK